MARKGINIRAGFDLKAFSKSSQNLVRKLKKTSKQMKSIGTSMSMNFTLPLVAMGAAAIKFSSDLQESVNKSDVAFGDASKTVKEFAKTTLKSFGIAESSSLEMATTFGDMATSMGVTEARAAEMSKALVAVAGDMASFKNVSIGRAQTALNAVFTGETESLKLLGIVMTQVELNAFAMSKGISKSVQDMTSAEKIAIRYQFILDRTKNSQGDFARTGGGAANQMRLFQETLKEISASFGQVILPVFTKFLVKINGIIDTFRTLNPETKKIIVILAGVTAVLGPLIFAIGSLSAALAFLIASPVTVAVMLLTSGMVALYTAIKVTTRLSKDSKKAIDGLTESYKNLDTQLKEIEKLKSTGIKLSAEVVANTKRETHAIITQTRELIKQGIEQKKALKLKIQNQMASAISSTQAPGRQGDFIDVEMGRIASMRKQIEATDAGMSKSIEKIVEASKSLDALENIDVIVPIAFTPKLDDTKLLTQLERSALRVKEAISTSGITFMDDTTLEEMGKAEKALEDFALESKASAAIAAAGWTFMAEDMLEALTKVEEQAVSSAQKIGDGISLAITDAVSGMVAETAALLGEFVANVATGSDKVARIDFGKSMLNMLGKFMQQFGAAIFALGIAESALANAIALGPAGAPLAIAGGLALIAAGAAISSLSSKGMDSGSSVSPASNPSSSGGVLQTQNIVLTSDINISGREMTITQRRERTFTR